MHRADNPDIRWVFEDHPVLHTADVAARPDFEAALTRVLAHEGGYVDHPRDPGGATNMGITRRTLAKWRGVALRDLPKSEVRDLSRAEAAAIYKNAYWDPIRGDELPPGLAYALFDFAVNSGPARAVRFLQRIVGTVQDGLLGGITLRAIARMPVPYIIRTLCDNRLAWMRRLPTWDAFGRGWSRRVNGVREAALAAYTNGAPSKANGGPGSGGGGW